MTNRYRSILLVLLGTAFLSCEVSNDDQEVEKRFDDELAQRGDASVATEATRDSAESGESDGLGELLAVLDEAISVVRAIRGDVPSPELVDIKQLDRVLPRDVAGLSRTTTEEKTHKIALFQSVSATYADAVRNVMVSVADLAPLSGLARHAFKEWEEGGIDRESDTGFERTRPFRVRKSVWPSYEKYQNENGQTSCQIQVWVAGRFFVGVEGDGVTMDVCEEARDDISFSRLERYAAESALHR